LTVRSATRKAAVAAFCSQLPSPHRQRRMGLIIVIPEDASGAKHEFS
jgi:hypothetical protein